MVTYDLMVVITKLFIATGDAVSLNISNYNYNNGAFGVEDTLQTSLLVLATTIQKPRSLIVYISKRMETGHKLSFLQSGFLHGC